MVVPGPKHRVDTWMINAWVAFRFSKIGILKVLFRPSYRSQPSYDRHSLDQIFCRQESTLIISDFGKDWHLTIFCFATCCFCLECCTRSEWKAVKYILCQIVTRSLSNECMSRQSSCMSEHKKREAQRLRQVERVSLVTWTIQLARRSIKYQQIPAVLST